LGKGWWYKSEGTSNSSRLGEQEERRERWKGKRRRVFKANKTRGTVDDFLMEDATVNWIEDDLLMNNRS
jgi:hypothetical protein